MTDIIHEKDKKWLQYNPNTTALHGDLEILQDQINEIIRFVNELKEQVTSFGERG